MASEVNVGDRWSTTVRAEPDEAASFARISQDWNPLHHDADYARDAGFPGVVVAGAYPAALLAGLAASSLSKHGVALGREFSFRFRRPVLIGDSIELQWEVIGIEDDPRSGGWHYTLSGRVLGRDGIELLSAQGRMLLVTRTKGHPGPCDPAT